MLQGVFNTTFIIISAELGEYELLLVRQRISRSPRIA
jgi:hypothetical protein